MKTKSYRLEDLKSVKICIGYVGENKHTQVRIDCSSAFAEYPGATPALSVRPPRGGIYPAVIETDGNIVVWTVTNSDLLFRGDGEIQLSFILGDVVKKTEVGKFEVHRSIITTANVPDPVAEWLIRATAAAAAAEAAAQHQPKIENEYWYVWDADAEDYVSTGIKAKGDKGDPGTPGDPSVLIDDTSTGLDKTWSASKQNTLLRALQVLEPAASASDVGKFLKVKLVSNGKVTEYEFGEGGSGSFDVTILAPQFVESQAYDNNTLVTYTDDKLYLLPYGHTANQTWENTPHGTTSVYEYVLYVVIPLINGKANKTDTILETTLSRGRKSNTTVGTASFAFGSNVEASAQNTHAEGLNTKASGSQAHSEGSYSSATGINSHAEGASTTASGGASHSEGEATKASGGGSHAEGLYTEATQAASHAEGNYTRAYGAYQHVSGKFNVPNSASDYPEWVANTNYNVGDKVKVTPYQGSPYGYKCKTANSDASFDSSKWDALSYLGEFVEIVGNGTGTNQRSNARTLDWDGNERLKGDLFVNANADGTGGKKVAKEEDVNILYDDVLDVQAIPSRNLNKTQYPASVTEHGVTITKNSDGSLSVSGQASRQFNYNPGMEDGEQRFLLPAGNYVFSGGISADLKVEILFYSSKTATDPRASIRAGENEQTFTLEAAGWVCIGITIYDTENDLTGNTFYPQLEAGTTATEYQDPSEITYKSQKIEEKYTKPQAGIPASDLESGVLVVEETVSGSTPSITGVANHRYICGECSTLAITAPASGIIDVLFESGSTATVLTVDSGIKWANGFDPTSLETNTTYELNILNGEYGVMAAWT